MRATGRLPPTASARRTIVLRLRGVSHRHQRGGQRIERAQIPGVGPQGRRATRESPRRRAHPATAVCPAGAVRPGCPGARLEHLPAQSLRPRAVARLETVHPPAAGQRLIACPGPGSRQLPSEPLPTCPMSDAQSVRCRAVTISTEGYQRRRRPAMRPVVEGRPVRQISSQVRLPSAPGKVRRRVAGRDQQIAGLQDRQQFLQVVGIIHVVEAHQPHAGRRLAALARPPCPHTAHPRNARRRSFSNGAKSMSGAAFFSAPPVLARALPGQRHLEPRPQRIQPPPVVRDPFGQRAQQLAPAAAQSPRASGRNSPGSEPTAARGSPAATLPAAAPASATKRHSRKRPLIGLQQPAVHLVDEWHPGRRSARVMSVENST